MPYTILYADATLAARASFLRWALGIHRSGDGALPIRELVGVLENHATAILLNPYSIESIFCLLY